MAFALYSDVRETTTTIGTGALTLAGAVSGYVAFSARYSNGDTMFVSVRMGANWETFLGTYASGAGTITRTKMFRSTNGNAAVDWGAGTKDIFVCDIGPSELDAPNKSSRLGTLGGVLEKYISGLTLSNGTDATNDIDIAAGVAADSTGAMYLRLAASITKRLDAAWAVGSGNGGLDTGSIANTTYHVWLIMRSDTAVVDVLFSASASSPTMPANYDYKVRIGSILRESGAIVVFTQQGDLFLRTTITSVDTEDVDSSALQAVLVPTGIRVGALVTVTIIAAEEYALVTSPQQVDSTPTVNLFHLVTDDGPASSQFEILTDTSGQIRVHPTGSVDLTIVTDGWVDYLGRMG